MVHDAINHHYQEERQFVDYTRFTKKIIFYKDPA